MTIFKTEYTKILEGNKNVRIVKKDLWDSFNENILGLGKIEKKSISVNVLSAIFDLEGFTTFCRQIDPQLAVPEYLSEFLNWIFIQIKEETIYETLEEGYRTYSDLPFLAKYLGDGLLFLWNTENMSETSILNTVASMYNICENYIEEFFPKISKKTMSSPPRLRCGIARGTVYSVGDGNDYVGPCINMSARLQKLNSLNFCFSRRGLDIEKMGETFRKTFIIKKVDIRGIGSDELVCIVKEKFDALDAIEKKKFKDI